MPIESGLWTVLPNGIDEKTGRLKASLFFSPRLARDADGGRLLSEYPLLSDWGAVVSGMAFVLELDGVVKVDTERDPSSVGIDPALWRQVFGDRVEVVDHQPKDLSGSVVNSFPANQVARDLLAVYSQVLGSSPFGLPPVTSGPLADFAGDVGRVGNDPGEYHLVLRRLFGQERSPVHEGKRGRYLRRDLLDGMGRPGLYAVTQRFYDRYRAGARLKDPDAYYGVAAEPPPATPPIDFHGYCAALGDYPNLLRRLGLVVDVVCDDPGLPSAGQVRVLFPDPPAPWFNEAKVAPWTSYEYRLPFFMPRPREVARQLFSQGQLDFHTEQLWVHQIDIDGSVLKALNAASSLVAQRDVLDGRGTPSLTEDAGSLPALRGAGLTVVRDRRDAGVVDQFDQQVSAEADVAAGRPAVLWAQDLTRGYAVDVERDGAGFASLCLRTGTYAMRGEDGTEVPLDVPADDEGYVKGASTTSVPGDDELYLHEALFSWSGWSLVAKRPGRRLRPDESVEPDPAAPLDVDANLPLVTSFVPRRGSLTPLRYGSAYRVRARLVDLAGNSVHGKALREGERPPSDPQTYYRWEPVPAPAIIPRRPYAEGESQLRMVIRSTLGTTPEAYVALPRVIALPGHDDAPYLATDSRWVVPPKTSQQMAELHGVFDAALGGDPADVAEQFAIAARESEVLPDRVPGDALALPYLPDVSSRAAAFRTLPGTPFDSSYLQPWPADATPAPWYDRQPFALEIVAGPAAAPVTPQGAPVAPAWADGERVLRISVPQAEVVRVRVSSGIGLDDLGLQGAWSLVAASLTSADRDQALRGRMWGVTPWLDLTLVHAVERPLLAPVVNVAQSGMARSPGEQFCALDGTIDNHAKSTGRLDIEASWSEQVDDVATDAPLDGAEGRGLLDGHAHVGDFEIAPTEDRSRTGRTGNNVIGMVPRHQLRHELGDTRHRLVRYRARATTRFREYFPAELATQSDELGVPLIEQRGPETELHVPSSRRPDPPDIAYVVPTFSWSQRADLDRVPVGLGRATARVRTRTVVERTRTCGLRVYLKRPWFSSGDGELLGVVLRQQPWLSWELDQRVGGMFVPEAAKAAAEAFAQQVLDRGLMASAGAASRPATSRLLRGAGVRLQRLEDASLAEAGAPLAAALAQVGPRLGTLFPHVEVPAPDSVLTAWGADPVHSEPGQAGGLGGGPGGGPFIAQFGLRVDVAPAVAPVEEPASLVTVVGHQPAYDVDRKLWYCDIDVPAGTAYTPFVRLALCRYQRWSLPGQEISKVVRAEYAQLMPTRVLRVRSGTPKLVTLSGPVGAGAAGGPFGLGSHRVQVRVESRPAGGTDLDWRPVGEPVELQGDPRAGVDDMTWSGTITPDTVAEGHERRLLVEEFEISRTDPDADDPLGAVKQYSLGVFEFSTRERLVYADSVPL